MTPLAYYNPPTLEAALEFLDDHGGDTCILAGGTDVMVDIRANEMDKKYLMDVTRLEALQGIEMMEDRLSVGALTTLSDIYTSDLIAAHAPTLKQCAAGFASKQIRNVATIGGNVAHCSPCGDTVPPLLVHEAMAVLAGTQGVREIPVEQIASGPYATALPSDEMIVRFILKPAKEMDLTNFKKIGRRKALSISRISMAAMVRISSDDCIEFIRFSLGACTPIPQRFDEIETLMTGEKISEPLLWKAGKQLTDQMFEITGRRSSAIYKEPAIQGLFYRLFSPLVN